MRRNRIDEQGFKPDFKPDFKARLQGKTSRQDFEQIDRSYEGF